MSTTTRPFDWPAFRDVVERLDADAARGLFADQAEYVQVDKLSPPSRPRVITGAEAIADALRDAAQKGIEMRLSDEVVGPDRVAYTATCRYPDGTQVLGMTTLQLRGGRIGSMREVQAWDE